MFGKPKAVKADRRFEGYCVEPKIDGFRVRIDYTSPTQLVAFGRRADYTQHLVGRIKLPYQGVYDTEVVVNGSLQATAAILPRHLTEPIETLDVYVFDILTHGVQDVAHEPYYQRRRILERQHWEMPVHLIDSIIVRERMSIADIAGPYIDNGYEGIVVKNPSGRYGDEWFKYKTLQEETFIAQGWESGRGEWAGSVGAIYLYDTAGNCVGKCSTSSNENRAWFTDNSFRLSEWSMAPVVEVAYQQKTRDGKLRHPRLLRIRLDLMEASHDPE